MNMKEKNMGTSLLIISPVLPAKRAWVSES
jgi:hypothetical protein